ncbi:Txe/YoeB family addiction module toxin [Chromobacterium sp. S0633]|uniref:Txe/YoeB family addiction module toxin n=1 Tax=Chromobacterium sp. S0633 TaxID=2957805 RepID=UPI00209CD9EC|nr:Txe/YoeB family addiction module toxin [Chromobacterium sp. S0633]MCP1292935.1 Txe/YoeB family addiction module toxin [Chromobacterium sp. S0633]
MQIKFDDNAWEDYLYWQQSSKPTLKRINTLIKAIQRNPFEGIGKPEPLKHQFAGFWSRRIDDEHRLVYSVQSNVLTILQCHYHY